MWTSWMLRLAVWMYKVWPSIPSSQNNEEHSRSDKSSYRGLGAAGLMRDWSAINGGEATEVTSPWAPGICARVQGVPACVSRRVSVSLCVSSGYPQPWPEHLCINIRWRWEYARWCTNESRWGCEDYWSNKDVLYQDFTYIWMWREVCMKER